jgi:riboflavin kinase/FMN adenylyltransferase
MEIIPGHRALPRKLRRPVVGIGNFDGVHRGHVELFAEVRRRAAAVGGEAVVFTFSPHPAKVLSPRFAPPLITTERRKLELIGASGVDACLVEPFDAALAALSPEAFVDQVLAGALGAAEVCVGWNFTFGRGRAGDARALAELGRARGFGVTVIEPFAVDGIVCSSTKVREFVLEGRMDGAALLLGRDFDLDGTVVRGAGRGGSIGVPTANLRVATELVPRGGVYAGWAELPAGEGAGERFAAAINIGYNPTFTGAGAATGNAGVEAHLLDFPPRPLYDISLRFGFVARLRDEARFASADELVAQIRRDVEATRAVAAARRVGATHSDG